MSRTLEGIANRLPGCRIVDTSGMPEGWDAADATAEGRDQAPIVGGVRNRTGCASTVKPDARMTAAVKSQLGRPQAGMPSLPPARPLHLLHATEGRANNNYLESGGLTNGGL